MASGPILSAWAAAVLWASGSAGVALPAALSGLCGLGAALLAGLARAGARHLRRYLRAEIGTAEFLALAERAGRRGFLARSLGIAAGLFAAAAVLAAAFPGRMAGAALAGGLMAPAILALAGAAGRSGGWMLDLVVPDRMLRAMLPAGAWPAFAAGWTAAGRAAGLRRAAVLHPEAPAGARVLMLARHAPGAVFAEVALLRKPLAGEVSLRLAGWRVAAGVAAAAVLMSLAAMLALPPGTLGRLPPLGGLADFAPPPAEPDDTPADEAPPPEEPAANAAQGGGAAGGQGDGSGAGEGEGAGGEGDGGAAAGGQGSGAGAGEAGEGAGGEGAGSAGDQGGGSEAAEGPAGGGTAAGDGAQGAASGAEPGDAAGSTQTAPGDGGSVGEAGGTAPGPASAVSGGDHAAAVHPSLDGPTAPPGSPADGRDPAAAAPASPSGPPAAGNPTTAAPTVPPGEGAEPATAGSGTAGSPVAEDPAGGASPAPAPPDLTPPVPASAPASAPDAAHAPDLAVGGRARLFAEPGAAGAAVEARILPGDDALAPPAPPAPPRQLLPAWINELVN